MAVADLERFFKTITADVVYIQWCIVLTWIASLASGISLSKSCASFAANITSSVVLRLYVQGTWELFVWTVQRCLCYAFYGTFIKFASTFHLRAYVLGPISTLHYLVWLYFCSLSLSLSLSLSQFIFWVVDGSCPEENFNLCFHLRIFRKILLPLIIIYNLESICIHSKVRSWAYLPFR